MALENELSVVLLLFVVWTTELGCKRINASPIIGQIAAGLIVGPALLDVIPHVQAFRLLGKLGVMILVIESGLAVDVQEIRKSGARASLAAATGVLLPTLLSFAIFAGVLGAGWKTALAVGASLSPTSLGFSAQLLGEVGELTSPLGQLICTAAVIDDVLSLLLLAEVQAFKDSNPEWYAYAVPVIASLGSVLVGSLATAFVSSRTGQIDEWLASLNAPSPSEAEGTLWETIPPKVSRSDLARTKSDDATGGDGGVEIVRIDGMSMAGSRSGNGTTVVLADGLPSGSRAGPVSKGDRVLLAMILAFSLLFSYLSAVVGSSDLIGCFFGGLAFSGVPGAQRVWGRQMKRYSQWGARLFFSATVAFSVPSIYKDGGLLRLKPFWTGLVLTVAAVVGKLAVGFFAGPPLTLSGFLQLGWAMNGRGEFSFLIAQEASDAGVLSAQDYSAVVWALLLSSIAAPVAFRRVLAAARRQEVGVGEAADSAEEARNSSSRL